MTCRGTRSAASVTDWLIRPLRSVCCLDLARKGQCRIATVKRAGRGRGRDEHAGFTRKDNLGGVLHVRGGPHPPPGGAAGAWPRRNPHVPPRPAVGGAGFRAESAA